MATKTIDDYLKLPYTIEVVHDVAEDHDVWFGRVLELPGCMTEADTFDELGAMIQDAMVAWIETTLEDGQPVPEPRPAGEYSGKFMVRVPRSLHRELAEGADREGVSLNAFLNVALARAVSGGGPVMAELCQAMKLLTTKIEESAQLKDGLVQQTLLQQSIQRQVQERSQTFLQERRRSYRSEEAAVEIEQLVALGRGLRRVEDK